MKFKLLKAPETEAPLCLEQEAASSEGTISAPSTPTSSRTMSEGAISEDGVYEDDEVYQAARILYQMVYSKG